MNVAANLLGQHVPVYHGLYRDGLRRRAWTRLALPGKARAVTMKRMKQNSNMSTAR